ncbi:MULTISPECIES: DUF4124 domain-containing protein [unclassified Stenotrophomonas]|jgi:hypothetical protein|uniref:DUF4124 domain-containing protein n=1 Tax=unclassified Stenotrophomonas TaxID=196198 RepID=UPI003711B4D6
MRALPLVCCLLLLASAPASAGTVYKWKDANGVTQYSEKPPAGRTAEQRQIQNRDPVGGTPQAKAAPAESADCTTARNNLALLNGKGAVLQDTDGDGKPDSPLDDTQRQSQKGLAEAGIKAYCKPAA